MYGGHYSDPEIKLGHFVDFKFKISFVKMIYAISF